MSKLNSNVIVILVHRQYKKDSDRLFKDILERLNCISHLVSSSYDNGLIVINDIATLKFSYHDVGNCIRRIHGNRNIFFDSNVFNTSIDLKSRGYIECDVCQFIDCLVDELS